MNKMIEWWAHNKVAANLLMVGIIVSGLIAFQGMEREIWPTFRINWVEVTVAWPGAAPQEVEEQVVVRIEEAIADLDNIDRIRAVAQEGLGQVYIEADPRINIGEFISDVKMRVDSINSFPRDIEQPRVREILTRNELIRIAVHGNVSERLLKRTADRMRDEVANVPGASIVELFGDRREEVAVELSENAMRRYGLTFDDVAGAIRGSSINSSSGTVRTDTGDVMLRARNLADSADEFGTIIVRQTADGGVVRVSDVARVNDGFEDIDMRARFDGEPGILVQVMTTEDMNVVKTSDAVKKWLKEAKTRLPDGVSMTLWWDDSTGYRDRMATITKSAISGLLLVFLVLIFSLRPKVAVWVTIGIATAFAGAFIFLPANGVSLNMLSTFAFLLVLGIIVDDAIVVGESIHRESMATGGGVKAAVLGTQLVAKPVIFAVITTMIAFMPWLFLSGLSVQITRHLSIIIIAALTFSLIEALFILPSHLATMKPRQNMGRFSRFQKRIADGFLNFADRHYRRIITAAVRRRYLTTATFLAFLIVSFGVTTSGWLKFTFMPEVENEMISVNVAIPDGTPYSRSLTILGQLEAAQKALEEEVNAARESTGDDGEEAGPLIENWYTRARTDSILALVQLSPPEKRAMTSKQVAERLRELIGDIPDAEEITVGFTLDNQNPDLQYFVRANNLVELKAAADDLKEKLRGYSDLYDVHDNLRTATDEIRLSLKPGAESLGLSLREVSRQMRQAYFGEEVQRLPRDGGDVKVMVRYPTQSRRTLESLADFRIRLAGGREIPLMAAVDITHSPGLKRILRFDRQRAGIVTAALKDDVRDRIIKDLEDNFFPQWKKDHPTVTLGAAGQAEGQAKFLQEVISLYIIALFAMYAVIAVAFKSYWEPVMIMTAIPFGFMGAVYGHVIFGSTISLFSYFGIGAAAGVVVNDNLVLVDYINRLRAQGIGAWEAIAEAGVARFRPIVLTSITTFVGLVPMMGETSTQAEFLKPAAISLAFGVAFAVFVTLAMVPALYGIGLDASAGWARARGLFRRRGGKPAAPRTIAPGE